MYFDKKKLAMFQVSEAFSNDIEDVLLAQGIRSNAIVRRKQTIDRPVTIPTVARSKTFLGGVANSVGVGANLITVGAAVAGLASCTVM